MKAAHTEGPWRVVRANPSPTTGEWMIAGAKPGYLAEVRDCGSGDVEANANLIAAAPELLESLKEMIEILELLIPLEGQERRKARAVVAKANGW